MAIYDPATDHDKMRALVQLAASIADQLANVASSLTTEAEMLAKADAPQHLPAIAALIKRSAIRTDRIVHDLLVFCSNQPVKPRVLSVASVMADLTSLLKRLVGPSITLTIDCADDVFPIQADLASFEHIMCTLVARARDAIPYGGTVTIRVTSCFSTLRGHGNVRIEVSDTGFAILSPQRIFEPVLARKSYGLWLGLSTVYGAIRQMGGQITVETDPSAGSKFTILVPAFAHG